MQSRHSKCGSPGRGGAGLKEGGGVGCERRAAGRGGGGGLGGVAPLPPSQAFMAKGYGFKVLLSAAQSGATLQS